MTAPTLRPYQTAALDATEEALSQGQNRLLWKMPTGTGKTVVFATLPIRLKGWLETFPANDRRLLVIAHREELLDQAAEKIHKANPHLSIGTEQGDRRASSFNDVVVASIQTLAARSFSRLERLTRSRPFRIVVVDEAHHAAAPTYRTALARLGFLPLADASDQDDVEAATFEDAAKMAEALTGWDAVAPKDRLLIGVTATPNRSDAIGLNCVFQTLAYSYPLKQAIEDGWLVDPVPWVVETQTSLDDVKLNRGEFNQRELAEAVNTAYRNRLAVAGWHTYAPGRPTIAFTVDVAHAHALAAEFETGGVRAMALSGETPRDDRAGILRAFREQRIDVITNCMVLTEGTDLPLVSCILHAKPTRSATLYEQMTGRGLRLWPDKSDCIVIDVVDVARKHSLMAAPVLYGLPPALKAQGKRLGDLDRGIADIVAKHPKLNVSGLGAMTLEELQQRIQAATFSVWTVRDMAEYGEGLRLNWIRTDDTAFRLEYPWQEHHEVLTVEPDLLGHFDVRVASTAHGVPGVAIVVAAGVQEAKEALRLAEGFVALQRPAVTRLADKAAAWRGGPASSKQIAFLRRLRVPVLEGLSKGEASDQINRAMIHRRKSGRAYGSR